MYVLAHKVALPEIILDRSAWKLLLDARLANAPETGQSADLMKKMDPMSHQWGSTHRTISKSWKWETFQTSCKREHWKNIKNRVNFLKNIPGAKRDTAVLQSLIKEAIVFRVGRGWKWWKCLSSTTWVCRLTRDVLDSFTNLSRTGTAGDIGGAFTASIILFYSNHPEFNCDAHILLWGWSLNSQEAWDTEERRRVLNSWIRLN